jgi:hypothetical protein
MDGLNAELLAWDWGLGTRDLNLCKYLLYFQFSILHSLLINECLHYSSPQSLVPSPEEIKFKFLGFSKLTFRCLSSKDFL